MGAKVSKASGESLQDVPLCTLELRSAPILKVHIQTTLSSNLVESVANTTLDHVAEGISHQVVQPTTSKLLQPHFLAFGALDKRSEMIAAIAAV